MVVALVVFDGPGFDVVVGDFDVDACCVPGVVGVEGVCWATGHLPSHCWLSRPPSL